MTMIFRCSVCEVAYHVIGPIEQLNALVTQSGYPCFVSSCPGYLQRQTSGLRRAIAIDVSAFFRAVNGFGFAAGSPASLESVEKLLLEKRVIQVFARDVGDPERTIIDRLVLDGGIKLHFAASAKGACIYYVEERGPSCVEVFDAQHTDVSQGTDKSVTENREEAGRDTTDGACKGPRVPGPTTALFETGVPPVPKACRVPPLAAERQELSGCRSNEDVRVLDKKSSVI